MTGAARCSLCGIHYPATKRVCEVVGCGEALARFTNAKPDDDWQERVDALNVKALDGDPDGLRSWREERYAELGFSRAASQVLARSRDKQGFALWWGVVSDALKRGATHDQCLRIYH